jgi:hypothetical protein
MHLGVRRLLVVMCSGPTCVLWSALELLLLNPEGCACGWEDDSDLQLYHIHTSCSLTCSAPACYMLCHPQRIWAHHTPAPGEPTHRGYPSDVVITVAKEAYTSSHAQAALLRARKVIE